MKKLMILAVAMVAMAMGGKAEAGFRLIITTVSNSDVISSSTFYNDTSSTSATITFSVAGFEEVNGTADVLTSNYPGADDMALLKQNIKLYNITAPSVNIKSISFQLDIVNLAHSVVTWDKPLGDALVTSSISADNLGLLPSGNTATVKTSSYINAVLTDSTSAQNAVSASDVSPGTGINIAGPFILTNIITVANHFVVTAPHGNIQFTGTSIVTPTVPEPTSLALAGFAGIGMAVGAIRRRRQAKQAA
jgi:hypothetical protein